MAVDTASSKLSALDKVLLQDDKITKDQGKFKRFFKENSKFEVRFIGTPSIFRTNTLGELYVFERENVHSIYQLSIDYQMILQLRNIDIENFWILENTAESFFNDPWLPRSVPDFPKESKRWIFAFNSRRIIFTSEKGMRYFKNVFGRIKQVIGYPLGELNKFNILILDEFDTAHQVIIGKEIVRVSSWKLPPEFPILQKAYTNTHMYLFTATQCFILNPVLKTTVVNLQFSSQESKFTAKELMDLYIKSCYSDARFFVDSKNYRILISGDDFIITLNLRNGSLKHEVFQNVLLQQIDSISGITFFSISDNLFMAHNSKNTRDAIHLGNYADPRFISVRNVIYKKRNRVYLKELKTTSVWEIRNEEYPYQPTDLDTNEWKKRAMPYMFGKGMIDSFVSLKKMAPTVVKQVVALVDCVGVLTADLFEIYSYSNGKLLRDFKDKIHKDTLFLLNSHGFTNFHADLELHDGCLEVEKFFFVRSPYLFIVSVNKSGSLVYQLEYARRLIIGNLNFTVILVGDSVMKLGGGLYVTKKLDNDPGKGKSNEGDFGYEDMESEVPNTKIRRIFPSLDRKHLLQFYEINGQALDPIQFYSFTTLEKLWKFQLFDTLLRPFFNIRYFFYKVSDDFGYFQTDYEYFVFDNRKRLSSQEYFWAQQLLTAKSKELSKKLSKSMHIYDNSMMLKAYFSPLVVALFNNFTIEDDVWSCFDYPKENFGESPLIIASRLPYGKGFIKFVEKLYKISNFVKAPPLSRNEFHTLLSRDEPEVDYLLVRYIPQILKYSNGFRQAIDFRVTIPNGVNVIHSKFTQFWPNTYNDLTESSKPVLPFFYDQYEIPESFKNKKGVETVQNREIFFINKFESAQSYSESYMSKIIKGGSVEADESTASREIAAFFKLNVIADLGMSTLSSDLFLKKFKRSENLEFVLSPYRHIIEYKWLKVRFFSIFQALMFMVTVVLYTIFVFNNLALTLCVILIILFAIFLSLEVTNLIVDFKDYFTDYENLFDLTGMILAEVCLIWGYILRSIKPEGFVYVQTISLIILYFRFFTFMKVIPIFTHVMVMIFEIFFSVFIVSVIIAICAVAFAISFGRTTLIPDYPKSLAYMYYTTFGNQNNTPFTNYLQWIIQIISGIFLGLILFNYMVAKMSVDYQDLYAKHEIMIYKYHAKLIHEVETRYRFLLIIANSLGFLKGRLEGTKPDAFIVENPNTVTFIATNDTSNPYKQFEDLEIKHRILMNNEIAKEIDQDVNMIKQETKNLYSFVGTKFDVFASQVKKLNRTTLANDSF